MKDNAPKETAVDPEFLRPSQAAKFQSISRRYLGHLTAIGVIPVYRIGPRCVRYRKSELIEAMKKFRQN